MQFEKIHACGNDFVLLYEVPEVAHIKSMCARKHGIGGDGVMVFLGLDQAGSPQMQHYEFDGSRSFCLNGLRASLACLYEQQKVAASGNLDYEGVQLAYKIEDSVHVTLAPGSVRAKSVVLDGRQYGGCYVETGNPHFIVMGETVADQNFLQFAPGLRGHSAFPNGANVHMIWQEDQSWHIRSYERGVEAVTLACGSGILAAASMLIELEHASPLTFLPEGGDFVKVASAGEKLVISGPTVWVASGVWRC